MASPFLQEFDDVAKRENPFPQQDRVAVDHPHHGGAGGVPGTFPAARSSYRSPPHKTQSTTPVNSRTISSADLHAPGFPDRLADVPVTAPESPAASARGTGWSGTRSPTVSPPPVTAGWTPGSAGSTSVRAPGQNRSMRRTASVGTCRAQRSTWSPPDRRSGIGFDRSRPL